MRILPNLALLAASFVVPLLFGECALRAIVGPPIIWKYPQESYLFDPELGHRLEPGQVAFTHDKPVHVNSQGIRDRDYPLARSPGAPRVLALGDSQTFGSGLLLSDTWPKQLEARLRELDPGTPWEILNGGITASDTWQHEHILERLTQAYEVDMVVLGFYTNDVSPRPWRAPRKLSSAARTNTLSKRVGYLAKRSAVLTALWQARAPLLAWTRPETGPDRESRVVSGDLDPETESNWEQVETSLKAMKARTREIDADFLLLILPRRDQINGSTPGLAYQNRIIEIARKLEIPAVDALAPLRDAYQSAGDSLFIPWDGHNSASANATIAEHVAPRILGFEEAQPIAVGDGE